MTDREVATRVFAALIAAFGEKPYVNEHRVADSAVTIAKQLCKHFPESEEEAADAD